MKWLSKEIGSPGGLIVVSIAAGFALKWLIKKAFGLDAIWS
jgi:hypothetical protein